MRIVRKELTPAQFSPANIRYNPTTDETEFTADNGITWVAAPSLDPRYGELNRFPALTGSDVKCRSAAGMTDLIRLYVQERNEQGDGVALASSILGIVFVVYPPAGALYAAFLTFAFAAVQIGVAVLNAAFTDDVYDAVLCLFYENIGDDGRMDESSYGGILERALLLPNPIAAYWVTEIVTLNGWVGMSNYGVAFAATDDCSGCAETWCYTFYFEESNGGFAQQFGGAWVSGQGWAPTNVSSGGLYYRDIEVARTFTPTFVTSIGFEYDYVKGSFADGGLNAVGVFCGNGSYFTRADVDSANEVATGDSRTFITFPNLLINGVYLEVVSSTTSDGSYSGNARLISCTMRGTGENPFGADNC